MSDILQVQGLTKKFGDITALDDVTFNAPSGGVIGLLGPNGSGKSTLIKLTMDMLQPDSGKIYIDGMEPSPKTKAITSFLPDVIHLDEHIRVRGQIKFYSDFFSDFDSEKCYSLLNRLGISPDQKIKTLSKGNKEKLSLILTMCRQAKLYILDEPIAGVDPAARDFILDTVMANRAEGSSILLCTHLIADIEPVLTHAIFINKGKIVLDSSVSDVYERKGVTLDELFREIFKW